MKIRTESIRWRIFVYNIMLLLMVALGCTMYYLLNDETIDKYNTTFTTYNELNHVYSHAKDMNSYYTKYLETKDQRYLSKLETSENKAQQALQMVKKAYGEVDQNQRFEHLKEMLRDYRVSAKPYHSELEIDSLREHSHNEYLKIMKTRGDYYEAITQDMQYYKNQVQNNRLMLGWMSVLLITLIILWIIYFSKTMLKSITDPIEKIVHNMNQIKMGEYDLTQISSANEEMNVLCLALDDMAGSIKKNIEYAEEKAELEKRVLEQQNENLKKDELLIQGELKILQNQINPHFLFNTLNMIYKKAYSEGAYETSELMDRTSQLLRYSLDTMNKISSLKDELKAIENYMFLQEKRFGERIVFHLHIAEDIGNFKMPTMILQPLVENAVQHGLKNTMNDGEVIVSASIQDNDLVLAVSDNGMGMSAQQVEELILNEFRVHDEDREHIGLYNVTRRLKAFYGNHVQIVVNSSEDCGFEIIIRITGEGER